MKLFDLHCDTAYEAYKREQPLSDNKLHVSLKRANVLGEYAQVFAIWSDFEKTDDECFEDFKKIVGKLRGELNSLENTAPLKKIYVSVEDGKLLASNIERLYYLKEEGVKFLIPMWSGVNCIGGAFDTDAGLSDFGKEVIKTCFEIGIVPDISHSSLKSAEQILDLAQKNGNAVIASHSCSFSVNPHKRNLHDSQFERIKSLGGIVGLSFCKYHLKKEGGKCTSDDIITHLEHYLSLGGEKSVALGADMDGAPLPDDIFGIESIPYLYQKLCDAFGKQIADDITWNNANNFIDSIQI